ncbi:MAG: hypothetical protein IT306_19750 [Chloroflexi bacterium]|nr:hypothetical protein [Chloroflexota bacterium]
MHHDEVQPGRSGAELAQELGWELDSEPEPGEMLVFAGRPWSESWAETSADTVDEEPQEQPQKPDTPPSS